MKNQFVYIICLLLVILPILFQTVSSETINEYSPSNNPPDELYWDIVYWNELIRVDDEGNVNISVRIMFKFYNKTSNIWHISINLGSNIINPVLHKNNHSGFIDEAEFVHEKHGTFLVVSFNSSISSVYLIYSLGFSYQVETPLIVEKVSAFYETLNRFRLSNPTSFSSSFYPTYINCYIALPDRASIHRHNVDLTENVVIDQDQFSLRYYDPDFLYPDTDDSFLEVPDIEEYHISKITINETFVDNKIFIEYTTPNDIIGILIIFAAIFSILGFLATIFKRRNNRFQWHWRRKKMKISWEKLQNAFLLIGLVTLATGVLFILTGVLFNIVNLIDAARWLASIGIAFISIGIACRSVMVSNQSDEKMKSIANATFMEIVDNLQDRFLEIKDNLTDYDTRKNYIWKWRTSIIRAFELRKWVDPEGQDIMIWAFISLIEKVPWKNNNGITNLEVKQLLGTWAWIWLFHMKSDTKSKLRNLLETHIDKLGEKEDIDSYVDRITEKISSKDEFSPFRKDG